MPTRTERESAGKITRDILEVIPKPTKQPWVQPWEFDTGLIPEYWKRKLPLSIVTVL